MTENEMKQHIIDNIHLLSKKDYIYFFGNPKDDPENIAISKIKFTKVELKIRAGIYIENWSWDTDKVYQHLIREYPFV